MCQLLGFHNIPQYPIEPESHHRAGFERLYVNV